MEAHSREAHPTLKQATKRTRSNPHRRADGSQPACAPLAAIIEQYQSPLLQYAAHFADAQTAQDIVQETFMRLHRQIREHGGRSVQHLRAWLFRVAHHQLIDTHRRETREHTAREHKASQRPPEQTPPEDASLDGLGTLIQRAASRRALDELAALPEKQRQVVALKIIHGMTFAEIAKVADMTVGNVGYTLGAGLKALAERLKHAGVM